MPLLLQLFGYLPAWAGVGHDLPRGVAQDWRNWSLTRGYLFSDTTLNTSGYSAYAGPLLALSISDDRGFAPPGTVRALLQKYVNARTQHREIAATEGHRGKIGQSPCQSEPSCLFRYPILGEQKAGAERETQA
jgi:predicted alpha/beta hydrolase